MDLWDDIKFIEKRIKEQLKYKWNLEHNRNLPEDRKRELDEACKFQYDRFVQRRRELE